MTHGRLTAIRTVAAPFASAVIVLLLGVAMFAGARRADDAAGLVAHTRTVIETDQALLARIVDAETGERGFVITGDTSYLDPYRGASAETRALIGKLRLLAASSAIQEAHIDTLAQLTERRLAVLDSRIALRRRAGFDSTRAAFVLMGGGRSLMDSARREAAAIDSGEQRLLETRIASEQNYQHVVLWIAIAGSAVAALLALAMSLTLSRAATVQTRLAEQVRAHAAELDVSNQQLQDQATEMEMLNEELRTTNEELEDRTVEAEEANRVKVEFLANMSHDLRTPLNAIVGYVDLLDAGVRGALTDDQRDDILRIKRAAGHLLTLINEVLDFAKIEAGQTQLRVATHPVESVLTDLETLIQPQVDAKKIEFAVECDPALTVRADRDRLDQILANLVGNAIKFTDSGGRIDLACMPDGSWVRTDVRDTGRGIPPDQFEAVFDAFVQLSPAHRTSTSGVGLGLSISRRLARAMGGELTVASTPGVGSTFTLRLPRGDAVPSNAAMGFVSRIDQPTEAARSGA